jgi:hypothetical protein
MSNPLKTVLEKRLLYSFVNIIEDSEVKQIASNTRYNLSFKRNKVIEFSNLRTDRVVKQTYDCWIFEKITLEQLEHIVGFGNETMEYLIISRDQSPLKVINKVFGVRCVCERLI